MQDTTRSYKDGIVVGLIAYASVAAFYGIFDVLASRGAFFTVDLLGKAVFRQLSDPSVLQHPIELDQTAILLYNTVHLLISLAIGLIVLRVAEEGVRRPERAMQVRVFIAAGYFVTVAAVGFLTEPMRAVMPWWTIAASNGLSTLLAGWYLLRRRPELGRLVPFRG